MITCTEDCKYQKNGECTYEEIMLSNGNSSGASNCAYFEQK